MIWCNDMRLDYPGPSWSFRIFNVSKFLCMLSTKSFLMHRDFGKKYSLVE